MSAKLIVALLAPLLLGSCMMAGMAGMGLMGGSDTHGTNSAAALIEPTIVKDVVVGGLRVTATFPAQAPGDALRYVVTIRDRDGRFVTGDVAVFLEVSPARAQNPDASPSHTGHLPDTVHKPSTGVERTRVAPAEREAGQFTFRPAIPSAGSYRVGVVVERVGDTLLDPAIVVDHVVTLAAKAPATAAGGHAMWSGRVTPLVLLSAGFMAVMMLVAVR